METARLYGEAFITGQRLTPSAAADFAALAAAVRETLLDMVVRAGNGHPGGSLSVTEALLMASLLTREDPDSRLVLSAGHLAPALYAILIRLGYLEGVAPGELRRYGSLLEGHPTINVPGVHWGSGMLGQGLSIGCGLAAAARRKGKASRVIVVAGDGESQKGQMIEAARFAVRYELNHLCCIVDANGQQASGSLEEVSPLKLGELFSACGFTVVESDGHDGAALYNALQRPCPGPRLILSHTVMGKGVAEIENDYRYHGALPPAAALDRALESLRREARTPVFPVLKTAAFPAPDRPKPPSLFYPGGVHDLRNVLADTLLAARDSAPSIPISVVDCDLLDSMKLRAYKERYPDDFWECGISESHAASFTAGLAASGIPALWFDFAVLTADEAYSQLRMANLNAAPVKLVATHCGLDVGEDGKTHQCIDYIGLFAHFFGFKILCPGDPNQASKALGYLLTEPGAGAICCGRSPLPVLTDLRGQALYGENYVFGRQSCEAVRPGDRATIFTYGSLLHRAVVVSDRLREMGCYIGVQNAVFPAEPDRDTVLAAARMGPVITYEDHHIRSGLGASVAAIIAEAPQGHGLTRLGVTRYGGSGRPDELYRSQALDTDSLMASVMNILHLEESTCQ